MLTTTRNKFLYCLFILFIPLTLASSDNSCGKNGNQDTICSPIDGETWNNNGTWYLFTWNPTYPTYVAAKSLSLYFYYVVNYKLIEIMSYHDVPNQGEFPIIINSTWFDSPLIAHEYQQHEARAYLLSSDLDPVAEMNNLKSAWPKAIHFNIGESVSSNQQGTSTQTSNDNTNSGSSSTWVTPLVLVICLLAIVISIIVFMVLRKLRRRKLVYGEKTQFDDTKYKNDYHNNNNTMFPLSPSDEGFKYDRQTTYSSSTTQDNMHPPPPTLQSMSNLSCRSDPLLTSTDALLIADTFRQRMRRPEWPHCSTIVQQQQEQQQDDENNNNNHKWSEDDEAQRRLASELLLKKELEAEGTLMKKVGKRANVLSVIQMDSTHSLS
ncbi:unnamed protein product [Cunninghamella echinulata]